MDAAFEDYLKTADLTQYEKINPNSRTISVDSKNFSLLEEQSQRDVTGGAGNKTMPLNDQVVGQDGKKAAVSNKLLPNTGSEHSIFLMMGMLAALAGILVSWKPRQK